MHLHSSQKRRTAVLEEVVGARFFRISTRSWIISQNGQTDFKSYPANAARFLKCLTILGHYALNGEAAPIFSNKTEFPGLTRGDRGRGRRRNTAIISDTDG